VISKRLRNKKKEKLDMKREEDDEIKYVYDVKKTK